MSTLIFNEENFNIKDYLFFNLKQSKEIIFITSFNSLGFFSNFLREAEKDQKTTIQKIRLLLINDSCLSENIELKTLMKDHYLNNGFDYYYYPGIANLQKQINQSKFQIEIKIDSNLENKIYTKIIICDNFATSGSNSFTYSSTVKNRELALFFEPKSNEYTQLASLAETLWEDEKNNYTKGLNEFLKELIYFPLQYQDVLRAFYEQIINGKWLTFKNIDLKENFDQLWIHQKQTIRMAIQILDQYNSVIIAEPTGSGKTRVGSFLLKYIDEHNKKIIKNNVVISPVNVEDEWKNNTEIRMNLKNVFFTNPSKLSNGNQDSQETLKLATSLLIDEGHGYKNLNSNRSLNLLKNNKSDYSIFLTATPINKKINDYRGFFIQIGADSLDNKHVENINSIFSKRKTKHAEELSESDLEEFKNAIKHITVRHNKQEINKINKDQKQYPHEKAEKYDFNFSDKHKNAINEIIKLSQKISGISFVGETNMAAENSGNRLNKYKAISIYQIKRLLRSSKVALLEHIIGTKNTINKLKEESIYLPVKNELNGRINQLQTQKYPSIRKITDDVPFFLQSEKNFEKQKLDDIDIYNQIKDILEKELWDDAFELHKIELVKKIMEKENRCLFFDSNPMTVGYYGALFEKMNREGKANVGKIFCITGKNNDQSNKDLLKSFFDIENPDYESNKNLKAVAFLSNVMSESVNLQAAASMVFSDLPLTPLIAEQRIGRISRLNSDHPSIKIYWPDLFFSEFGYMPLLMKTDQEFAARVNTIEKTIKSNFEIPNFLKILPERIAEIDFNDDDLKEEDFNNDEIKKIDESISDDNVSDEDTWGSVDEGFKSDFDDFIKFFEKSFLETQETNNNKDPSIVSIIKSKNKEQWGFFLLQHAKDRPPIICFLDKDQNKLKTNMAEIVQELNSKFIDKKYSNEIIEDIEPALFKGYFNYYEKTIKKALRSNSFISKKKYIIMESFKKSFAQENNSLSEEIQHINKKINDGANLENIIDFWQKKIDPIWTEYLEEQIKTTSTLPSIKGIQFKINSLINNASSNELKEINNLLDGKEEKGKLIIKYALICIPSTDEKITPAIITKPKLINTEDTPAFYFKKYEEKSEKIDIPILYKGLNNIISKYNNKFHEKINYSVSFFRKRDNNAVVVVVGQIKLYFNLITKDIEQYLNIKPEDHLYKEIKSYLINNFSLFKN